VRAAAILLSERNFSATAPKPPLSISDTRKRRRAMDAQLDPRIQLPPTARKFLEETTMKSIFGISDEALDAVMALAYQLYQVGRYPEVAVLCRGLIAADHKYWWSYSLYAATLRRLGKLQEALEELTKGLVYEPAQPKLLFMRNEICEALVRRKATPAANAAIVPSNPNTNPNPKPQIAA
jgi:tetratricopeptide (TPR) repeat protein